MSRLHPARIATAHVPTAGPEAEREEAETGRRLAVSLLAGSPRVLAASPRTARVDARGWDRRGGEPALARTLREAALEAGFADVGIGVADVPVASDAAAALACAGRAAEPRRILIVPPGGAREFLAPLPLSVLPLPDELAETFRALGLRRVGELADRPAEEFETRFGPAGLRAHRLARGLDDRPFLALDLPEVPEAGLELDTPADTLEPLLFVLRHLLARVCAELGESGCCAARLELGLRSRGRVRTATVVPARPTCRERLLYDLCRAALERAAGAADRLSEPVEELTLRVVRRVAVDARQEDLFTRRWRDPLAAAAALSRLRVRLGEEGVVHPAARADHRPESRSAWIPVETTGASPAGASPAPAPSPGGFAAGASFAEDRGEESGAIPGILHLLPDPVEIRVRLEADRPAEIQGAAGHHRLVAAEGPERLSGDWWKDPYHREYFRVCTEAGALLWLFREYRPSGAFRWWLHGWWD